MLPGRSQSLSNAASSSSTANLTSLSGGAISDLHFKMSKKIAQLTKVIYHLHTKNDDHEWEMKNVSEQYENEITEILTVFGIYAVLIYLEIIIWFFLLLCNQLM